MDARTCDARLVLLVTRAQLSQEDPHVTLVRILRGAGDGLGMEKTSYEPAMRRMPCISATSQRFKAYREHSDFILDFREPHDRYRPLRSTVR